MNRLLMWLISQFYVPWTVAKCGCRVKRKPFKWEMCEKCQLDLIDMFSTPMKDRKQ